MKKYIKRFLPLIIVILAMVIAYFFGLYDFLSFDMLKEKHRTLKTLVAEHRVLTPLIFMGIYTVSTALSIPGGIFLSLLGGYLFPLPLSTLYVMLAATLGATIIFFAARTAVGDWLRNKAGSKLQKMREGFEKNSISYMLFLRLAPIFPFWLVNIAPAFFGIPIMTYIWTTFVGIAPGAFVFTQAGSGIETILDSQEEFSLNTIFNVKIQIALICLAIFALMPVIIKAWKKHRDRQ